MLLSVAERLLILDLLPARGSLVDLRVVQDLKRALAFSEDEHATLKFSENGNTVHWDDTAETPLDVELGARAREIVRKGLRALSEAELLTPEHLPLCDTFAFGPPHEHAAPELRVVDGAVRAEPLRAPDQGAYVHDTPEEK